jgi:hypothetical protein
MRKVSNSCGFARSRAVVARSPTRRTICSRRCARERERFSLQRCATDRSLSIASMLRDDPATDSTMRRPSHPRTTRDTTMRRSRATIASPDRRSRDRQTRRRIASVARQRKVGRGRKNRRPHPQTATRGEICLFGSFAPCLPTRARVFSPSDARMQQRRSRLHRAPTTRIARRPRQNKRRSLSAPPRCDR